MTPRTPRALGRLAVAVITFIVTTAQIYTTIDGAVLSALAGVLTFAAQYFIGESNVTDNGERE